MAKKIESSFRNMVLALLSISMVASFALGAVYNLTKDPIAKAQQAKKEEAIKQVVPAFDRIENVSIIPAEGGDPLQVNKAYNGDSLVGYAVETYSDKGFSGRILLMVGFLPDGTIFNTAVLKHSETPGLGDKMDAAKSGFPEQFRNQDPASFTLKVKKDGGQVDAITAATISSRAFCDGVQRAYNIMNQEGGLK
ncbi:MAG TPA: RnfABCDGE type electron transport complex subunit G [Lentimicrobium sp.]|jgi:electron transport complex protein RnfG|nr:RnfABCDGE type electron transport complex subunit G [Lentimicrobium sp.]